MNKIITKEDLKDFVFPGLFGFVCLNFWINDAKEILIFLLSAMILQIYFACKKEKKIKIKKRKKIFTKSELRTIARIKERG
jgi:uncharacterized membrane protein YobD (UPF0266 family)